MSVRKLTRALGLSASQTSELLRRGMPNEPEKAQEWRLLYVRPRARPQRRAEKPLCRDIARRRRDSNPVAARQASADEQAGEPMDDDHTQAPKVIDFFGADGLSGEELEDTIPRLRRLEKATALALERALKADNLTAAVALRREYCTALRTLYNAEEKLIKINVSRGKYVTVERALNMIDESLKAPILMLRRLPDLGRDSEERAKLEAFLNAVLNEMKAGAERGLNRTIQGRDQD